MIALYIRAYMQIFLFAWGRVIQNYWPIVMFITNLLFVLCCIPLKDAIILKDIVQLWVEGKLLEIQNIFLYNN